MNLEILFLLNYRFFKTFYNWQLFKIKNVDLELLQI